MNAGQVGELPMNKKNKMWLCLAIFFLAFTCAALFLRSFFTARSQGTEILEVFSDDLNQSIVCDTEDGIIFVGGHNGSLAALRDGELLWKNDVGGAFRKLVLSSDRTKLYAANEANRVYVFGTDSGSKLLEIDTKRLSVGVSVNSTGSRIAVITNTGSSKSTLFIYSDDGEELANIKYSKLLRGIEFCSDDETIMIADKRGDITHISQDGSVLGSFSTNYDIVQMKKNGDYLWAVCKNGSYYAVNEDLECVRKGKINNTVKATISRIGVDIDGDYVVVGSEEGYIFVLDKDGRQISVADLGEKITDTSGENECIYITNYTGNVYILHVNNLDSIELNKKMVSVSTYALVVSAILFFISIYACFPKNREKSYKLIKAIIRERNAYLMLLPLFILMFLFCYRGIYIALIRSFTDWSSAKRSIAEIDFIGLSNYKRMVTEGYFLTGIKNLCILIVAMLLKNIPIPLAVAWMLHSLRGAKQKYIFRFLFVLPIVVPSVVTLLIWAKIYDPSIGLLNQTLGALGLSSWQRVWLGNEKTAFASILFVGFPFIGAMPLLVFYGGLLNIDHEIIESARIDGASTRKIFWNVQVPMLRPQITLMVTLTLLAAMKEFNGIYILTGGGPGTSTYVPALELYLNTAQFGRYGYSSALGVVLLIFTLVVTLINNRLTKERG